MSDYDDEFDIEEDTPPFISNTDNIKDDGEKRKFYIEKKNRKFFEARLISDRGIRYRCKIVIDDNSKNLAIGNIKLLVEDVSIRNQYGTNLIFKVK